MGDLHSPHKILVSSVPDVQIFRKSHTLRAQLVYRHSLPAMIQLKHVFVLRLKPMGEDGIFCRGACRGGE